MPDFRNSLSRMLWHLFWTILCISVVYFTLSSYYFSDIYTASRTASLSHALAQAREVLDRYAAGDMTRDQLRSAVNPAVSIDSGFYMLLDGDQKPLAYTDGAAPYFAGDAMQELMERLSSEGSAVVRSRQNGTALLLMAERTDGGTVVAGRTLQALNSEAVSFRVRLLVSMLLAAAVVLLISFFLAKRISQPARLITEAAGRLAQGERLKLPENLRGKDFREVAAALNDMSDTVARAMDDLKYEKETMTLILEGISEGILAVDGEGKLLMENAAAWELLGSADTDVSQAVTKVLWQDVPESSRVLRFVSGQRVLRCAVSRLPGVEGRGSRGAVALIRDVTEEERLERTRHDYVANISHELRAPLSSIRGLAEGLRDGMVTDEKDTARYYEIIVEEATRLSRLVDDLLELSSLQSNPASFEMERMDPGELARDMFERNRALFGKSGLFFGLELPEAELPCISSNEDRLAQVLTIFLDNARKYTPAGGTVTLGAERAWLGVRFFVRDTGIGMDEETCRLAFERFHQAEPGRDKGSGLGLAIAREILQKMGVTIQVRSEPGKGSVFSFVIPAE